MGPSSAVGRRPDLGSVFFIESGRVQCPVEDRHGVGSFVVGVREPGGIHLCPGQAAVVAIHLDAAGGIEGRRIKVALKYFHRRDFKIVGVVETVAVSLGPGAAVNGPPHLRPVRIVGYTDVEHVVVDHHVPRLGI